MSLPAYLTLFEDFKKNNHFLTDLPSDVEFSIPACLKRADGVYDAFFLYTLRRVKDQPALTRPFAWGAFSADGRNNQAFSWCNILDFVTSGHFPLGNSLSPKLPSKLSAKELKARRTEMLGLYDTIREFAFCPEASVSQLQTLARFKTLFSEIVPEGLYPFYYALSPDFFDWMRLPLPKTAVEPITLPSHDREILDEVRSCASTAREQRQLQEQQQEIIDSLHEELQMHRNQLLTDLTRPIERDVIMVIDDIQKTLASFRDTPPSLENQQQLLMLFQGVEQDLTDLLYRQGVDPYSVEGEPVAVPRQKVIQTVPTNDLSLDKTVARRISLGWEKEGRVVRPEYVSAYLYHNSAEASANQPAGHGPEPPANPNQGNGDAD